MATLQQLASVYCSSDEEDTGASKDQPAKKRKLSDEKKTKTIEGAEESHVSSITSPAKRDVLALPESIVQMFKDEELEITHEDPSEHGGRIRSFPHLPGNWATHVYIPVKPCEEVQDMVMEMLDSLQAKCMSPKMYLFPLSELHLSLSRTVPIRHYWIQPIVQQLQAGFCNKRKFLLSFGIPEIYINDEKTRSFLGLTVSSLNDEIENLVRIVDAVFREFGLEEFYENPSFHTSVSWCLGDVKSQLPDDALARLRDIFHKQVESHPSISVLEVKEIFCKTGNKLFKFPLS